MTPTVVRRCLIPLLAVAAAGSSGCMSATKWADKRWKSLTALVQSSYHDPDAEAKMASAMELFEAGKFAQAQPIFADLADNTYNPIQLAEKARYHEAECLRERGRIVEAVTHYNKMLQDYPAGAYRERGCGKMFELAYGWLEDETLKDIEAEANGTKKPWWATGPRMPNFLDKSRPFIDQEGEALKYLEHAHTHDLTGPTADKALYWCGYVHFCRGRFEEADHFLSQLVEMHKDSPLHKQALELAILAKNNSTGGAVYDGSKAAEALQLANYAEGAIPEYATDPDKQSWLLRQKLAVHMQQAEKEYRRGEYYERAGHPGAAYFSYDLVCRTFPGTKWSDLADGRKAALEKVKAASPAGGIPIGGPVDTLRREIRRLVDGKPQATADPEAPVVAGPTGPQLPVRTDLPPQ